MGTERHGRPAESARTPRSRLRDSALLEDKRRRVGSSRSLRGEARPGVHRRVSADARNRHGAPPKSKEADGIRPKLGKAWLALRRSARDGLVTNETELARLSSLA
mmetsp:Transcript_12830/g.40706  ORF Transcript_12830/g.40706 Transcript_12830/m.40706 type:complete len:105 (-) Transcript_12830:134-448(-)